MGLIFIKNIEPHIEPSGKKRGRALFKCICGKEFIAGPADVKSGNTKSCGCVRKIKTSTHKMSSNELYKRWIGIKGRCHNPKSAQYKYYGERGIDICNRWLDFANFFEDMGKNFKPGLEVDRIDNNKGYSPENCRWATRIENQRNKRNNVVIQYKGEQFVMSSFCEKFNLVYSVFKGRINEGWSVENAMEIPKLRLKRKLIPRCQT